MTEPFAAIGKIFPPACHEYVLLAGGSVRDHLLGKSAQDFDLIAILGDIELRRCGFRPVVGKTTAPIWFRCDPALGKIEVTQLPGLADLDTDLSRRDFTINAMVMRLSGDLLDPLNGRADLHARALRACSTASFDADPLRIFRALRFEADGWRMVPETEQLLRARDRTAQLEVIPVERFSRELLKALAAEQPERFLQRMVELNVGRHWLPELFRMGAIPAGPLQYHPEGDLFTHAAQVLQRAASLSSDPLARFCAFFHDLGKLATDPAIYPRHHGHEEAGASMAVELCSRLALPADYRRALAGISRLHPHLNRWEELRDATRIKIAEQAVKAGIVDILPVVSRADKAGAPTPAGWPLALKAATMTTAGLGIDAERLAAMPPAQRPAFLLQKRVEKLRELTGRASSHCAP